MLNKRPATSADYEFLYNLHKAAMQTAVSQTWGWDEAWQQNYFKGKFDPAKREILLWDGQEIGALSLKASAEELYLAYIAILPRFQGSGWGPAVIQELIQQAEQQNKPLTLHVLQTNPLAKKLCERLGFQLVAVEQVKYKMQFASQQTPD
jgi:ribosomal protein S18 acetylase RimI-like enzyme